MNEHVGQVPLAKGWFDRTEFVELICIPLGLQKETGFFLQTNRRTTSCVCETLMPPQQPFFFFWKKL